VLGAKQHQQCKRVGAGLVDVGQVAHLIGVGDAGGTKTVATTDLAAF